MAAAIDWAVALIATGVVGNLLTLFLRWTR